MTQETEIPSFKPIVVKALINEKNPRLAKRLPGFVYTLINKLLHINEVNAFMQKYGHLSGIEFITQLFNDFGVTFQFQGTENLPAKGRFLFASNHPLGGFDGLILLYGVDKLIGPSLFLVRDELTKIPQLKPLFVPVNKHGGQRNSATLIHDAYTSDKQVLIFPSGMASRKIGGKITDLAWNKHFIQKSVEYQRDVIPVHIEGHNSKLFYWLANFRKRIGIKFNIEMFLLADEMFKQKGRNFVVSFGKPIPWQQFDHTKSPAKWADWVKHIVYQLPSEQKKN